MLPKINIVIIRRFATLDEFVFTVYMHFAYPLLAGGGGWRGWRRDLYVGPADNSTISICRKPIFNRDPGTVFN